MNEGLNTTSHKARFDGYCWDDLQCGYYQWQTLGYNNKEVHGDRVTFFITEMPAGRRTLTYLARATRPGVFVVMPAEAYAMYDPSRWGRSASDRVQIWR